MLGSGPPDEDLRRAFAREARDAPLPALSFGEALLRLGRTPRTTRDPLVSIRARDHPRPVASSAAPRVSALPAQWDWRNVDGKDYVGAVRDQLRCGSCYAFAATGIMEMSIRIQSQLAEKIFLSPQDVVSCSQYSEGCSGGYEYLVGKYAADHGLAELRCMAYPPEDWDRVPCSWKCNDTSLWWYATDYHYIGSYYGNCSEDEMMRTIYTRGPISVGIYTYGDFFTYKSGIYHHVPTLARAAPNGGFEPTTHSVILVGWGVDPISGEKYWILRNSWNSSWGEKGYMRIRRGSDESAVESDGFTLAAVVDHHPPAH